MNTLITGLIIVGVAIVFVDIVLFGFLNISIKSVSFGNLFLIQLVFALFILFLYQVVGRKK